MTNLLVITFPDAESAQRARDAVRGLERQGLMKLEDAAVLSRDAEGKTHVHNEFDRSAAVGAGAGALVGLVLSFGFPLLGLALGAGGGALTAKALDRGLDKRFVGEVEAALQPGTSALAVVFTDANAAALRGALEPYEGRIYQTTIDPETAEQLRSALKG